MGFFPDRNAPLAQPRNCVCKRIGSSGDRDELLPANEKSMQVKEDLPERKAIRDGGVASKHKVP